MTRQEQKQLLYKKLNALRLEVHESIVDDIKQTVDALFAPAPAQGVEEEFANAVHLEAKRLGIFSGPTLSSFFEGAEFGSRWQQGQEYPSAHGHAPLSNVQNTPERVVVGYGASVGRPGARAIYRAQRRQHEEWFDKVLAQEDGLLKEVINAAGKAKSQTAPTIGVSWVREEIEKRISYLKKTDAEVCKERWDMTQPEFKRRVARDTSNFLTERRHELEDLLKLIPSSESPFPTKERAIEWANGSYPGDDIFAVGARNYMIEMYDWITLQLKQVE